MRNRILAGALLALAAMAAGGCGGNNVQPPDQARVRTAHFAPGAPNTDILGGSSLLGSNLNFEKASGYTTLDVGDYRVKALEAGKTNVLADNLGYFSLVANRAYTLFLGEPTVGHYSLLASIDESGFLSSAQARVRFFHLAPDVPDTVQALLDDLLAGQLAQSDVDRLYYTVTPGTYNARIRALRDASHVYAERNVQIVGGKRYTLVFSGVNTGGPGYRVTVLTDSL